VEESRNNNLNETWLKTRLMTSTTCTESKDDSQKKGKQKKKKRLHLTYAETRAQQDDQSKK
jgi:hypothetical protein